LPRAGARLYVGGFHGPWTPRGGHWHGLVEAGLRSAGVAFAFDSAAIDADAARPAWSGDGLRLIRGGSSDTSPRTDLPRARQKLPDWVRGPAPAERVPPRPLMPSRPEEEDAAGEAGRAAQGGWGEPSVLSPLAGDQGRRFRRGTLLHRLLQRLPDVPVGDRAAFATTWLAREAADLDADIRAGWAGEAVATLALPDAAALFAPGSRAEAPVVGMVDTPSGRVAISGQIDRLAVTDTAILLADIKTNRPPPERVEDVPRIFRRQLALYRALLAGIYPDRPVRGFLLWTDGPRLMEVPAPLLDAALMPA
ncbi:MAG: PD-(D/E)XK nuclease family protein, partial [Reyranellaceae bacterium]